MSFDLQNVLYSVPAVVVGLTVHEYAHAYTANRLGDPTAKDQGRITLNPVRHIDPIGMLFIVIAGFGWAKPVQFSPENLKKPKLYKALIALAGPLSNLALGLLTLICIKAYLLFSPAVPENVHRIIVYYLFYMAVINLGLFIFNILPFPPLDGSHVFFSGLNLSAAAEQKMMQFGSYALFAVLFIESRSNVDLIPIGTFTDYVVGLFFK